MTRALLLLLAGCGRVAFDPLGDGGGNTGQDTQSDGSDELIPPGLVAHYPLDDDFTMGQAQERVADRVGGCAQCPTSVAGALDGGAEFDGSTQCLSVPLTATELAFPSFTVAAWMRPRRIPAAFDMVVARAVGGGAGNSFTIDFAYNGTAEFYTSNQMLFSAVNPALDEWVHVVARYNVTADLKSVFVNGVFSGMAPPSSPITYDAHPITIGCDVTSGSFSNFFQGTIDDVMLFDRALSDAEIMSIAQR